MSSLHIVFKYTKMYIFLLTDMLWIYFLIQIKFDCNQNVDGYALDLFFDSNQI